MKDYYNNTETTKVYGYGYNVVQGSGIWSTLFKKAADVFTKKAIQETAGKVVEQASKKALDEGSKILVDKATKKTGELVNKYLGGEDDKKVPEAEQPVVLKESNKSTKLSKEELQHMKRILNRIKQRNLRKDDDDDEDDDEDDY